VAREYFKYKEVMKVWKNKEEAKKERKETDRKKLFGGREERNRCKGEEVGEAINRMR
jgi:hypothetical protein